MPDLHYENPKLAALYDFDSGWSADRAFYLSLAGAERQSILDLGCGTGLLCDAYAARGHDVTGADPSAAMLDVARRKPHGGAVEWVQSDAQNFHAGKRFDLIVMTGHAFQVLLEDEDILAAFSVMKAHLAPGGLIVFESRNPRFDWASEWDYTMTLDLSGQKVIESRQLIAMDNDRMTFELRYQFPDETLISQSTLRFLTSEDVKDYLKVSGLRTEKILGDWDGQTFDEKTSREMIFFAR